jgi:hypothetical protein
MYLAPLRKGMGSKEKFLFFFIFFFRMAVG